MPESTPDTYDSLVDSASEFIRAEGEIVSIGQVLEDLSTKFGGQLLTSLGPYAVLVLIEMLWEETHTYQPEQGSIEFVWDERRSEIEGNAEKSLAAALRQHFQSHPPTSDESGSSPTPDMVSTEKHEYGGTTQGHANDTQGVDRGHQ